jgi:IS605 OrfB family transposase
METEVPETVRENFQHIVGIDRGLNFIVATADDEGRSFFKSGREALHKRHQFANLRKRLQKHNTRGSKRKVKLIGNRENRWMSDLNHRISKALVDHYGQNTLFVLEDLTGVTFEEDNLHGTSKARQDKRTWAFYQLEQFLVYKAEAIGSKVLLVSPKYTSQRCPHCGIIDKKQRHHDTHEYRCRCGYRTNDDRVGALNLLELGRRYLTGGDKPKFKKNTQISIAI